MDAEQEGLARRAARQVAYALEPTEEDGPGGPVTGDTRRLWSGSWPAGITHRFVCSWPGGHPEGPRRAVLLPPKVWIRWTCTWSPHQH